MTAGTVDPTLGKRLVRLPAAYLLVLLGAFLATLGAAGGGARFAVAGVLFLAVGLYLFWDEGRWSRALIRPGPSPAVSASPPWWKRPISYHGRWLCTSCGWREEERTTFCPRCGKVLVRLPSPPEVKG